MRSIALVLLFIGAMQPAFAADTFGRSDADVFRPVSFICRDGATGTSVKIEENILGNRKLYEVGYFSARPTLFVISQSRNGRAFQRVALIDLRSENNPDKLEAAHYLSLAMAQDAKRFCKGTRGAVLAARYELQANHLFNRSHPRYKGK
jgi:hypothetical protein